MDPHQVKTQMAAESQVGTNRFALYRVLFVLVLIYFLAFGILMANLGGQPDEPKHLYYSNRFAETWGIPKEDPASAYRITGFTYLYYWLNGAALKIFRLVAPGSSAGQQMYLLRLLSVCTSAITLIYVYKLASKVTGNRYAGVLASFFMANTLMFVFVSSGVTYDNFMNLASVAAIYHLVNIYRDEDFVRNTALLGAWLCLGALAKEQVLLLAFLLFIAWLVYLIRARKRLNLTFSRANLAWIAVFSTAGILFLGLYGVNVFRYHHLIPSCPQVKGPQVCTLFAWRKPFIQPVNIRHLWSLRETIQNPFSYALNFWIIQMLAGIWGVVSHNSFPPLFSVALHGILILWACICISRYWKREHLVPTVLLLLLLTYTGYVLLMNYRSELRSDFRHFAVQGRYLFPMLGVLITLMINYFLQIRSLFLRKATLAFALVVYFAGGLGLFIFRYSQVFGYWRIHF
jgi:4-amino-4-deoxy-L-arabinose transferase-like glycosyltransferase